MQLEQHVNTQKFVDEEGEKHNFPSNVNINWGAHNYTWGSHRSDIEEQENGNITVFVKETGKEDVWYKMLRMSIHGQGLSVVDGCFKPKLLRRRSNQEVVFKNTKEKRDFKIKCQLSTHVLWSCIEQKLHWVKCCCRLRGLIHTLNYVEFCIDRCQRISWNN